MGRAARASTWDVQAQGMTKADLPPMIVASTSKASLYQEPGRGVNRRVDIHGHSRCPLPDSQLRRIPGRLSDRTGVKLRGCLSLCIRRAAYAARPAWVARHGHWAFRDTLVVVNRSTGLIVGHRNSKSALLGSRSPTSPSALVIYRSIVSWRSRPSGEGQPEPRPRAGATGETAPAPVTPAVTRSVALEPGVRSLLPAPLRRVNASS